MRGRGRGGLVIAQLNPRVPYTYGDAVVSAELIDYAIEAEAPLASPPRRPTTDVSAAIAGRVAALIGDGATLQLGIGAVPDAVRGHRAAVVASVSQVAHPAVREEFRRAGRDLGLRV
jgi:acyl-CoA hydrolase